MPPLSLLIKPASGNCNLRCEYCFYHSLIENRTTKSYGMMNVDLLEELVKNALQTAEHSCTFAFQGGEPTLVGLDFYNKLIDFEKKYNAKGLQINNAIQTNGMLIDDNWARFFADNNFLVGLSLDGPKEINDYVRYDDKGKGSFNRIMKTVQLFNKYNVQYNILCVVTDYVARHANKIYNFYKNHNFKYLQFIECLDPLGEVPGGYNHSLTSKRYATFLKTLFDLWYADIINGNAISIRHFDNYVSIAMGHPAESCSMNGFCTCYCVIEANGGVYPCDFYVTDEWYLGNIKDKTFNEFSETSIAKEFVEVSKYISLECKECKWYNLCRGGCRRNREPFEDGKPVLNRFCQAYKEFFEYAGERIYQLADAFSRNNS